MQDIKSTKSNTNSFTSQGNVKQRSEIKNIFITLISTTIMMNFDSGVFPPVLDKIQNELNISAEELAFIGNLPYLGICVMTLFVPYFYSRFPIKKILIFSLVVNIFFCVLITFSQKYIYICLGRLMQGVSQCFFVTYTPIWIVNFAPKNQQATWVGINQAFSPLGIVFGYMISGSICQNFQQIWVWRVSIFLQGVLLLPIIILILIQKKENIDLKNNRILNEDQIIDNYHHSLAYYLEVSSILSKNKIYLFSSFILIMQFFTVSVFMFWGTSYFEVVLKMEKSLAMVTIGMVCITAPIFGVILGGTVIDKLGGVRASLSQSLLVCLKFTIISYVFINSFTLITQANLACITLWLGIGLGAGIIPIMTTLMIESVDKQLSNLREIQPIAQCYSILFNNLFGYFLSPLIASWFMMLYHQHAQAMQFGIRTTLLFGNLSWILIIFAYNSIIVQPDKDNNAFDNANNDNSIYFQYQS